MISVEVWTTIRTLRAQGHSISTISRQLHLSRKAIRRALHSSQPPRYHRKPVENPQLVPFIPVIREMTTEHHLIGSRIEEPLAQVTSNYAEFAAHLEGEGEPFPQP